MMIYIKSEDIKSWKMIITGPRLSKDEHYQVQKELDYKDEDWKQDQINAKATQLILCALTVRQTNRVLFCKSAKEIWERLEVTHEGTNQVKETKINMLLHDHKLPIVKVRETITLMLDKFGETIHLMLDKFADIMSELANIGRRMDVSEKVKKILITQRVEFTSTPYNGI